MIDSLFELRPERPGYRLQRLELYNWGTFDSTDGRVYTIEPHGRTALLVGQNGSGKSTLVDAVLTLLVPAAIRNYNVAAGAKKTERSERSYIRGACGQGSDDGQAAVTRYLRPGGKHYSALLAVFGDEQLGESFSLLQVLYLKADDSVEKLFAMADGSRRLADDLLGIERAEQVRVRLQSNGYRTSKKFSEYHSWFARHTHVRGKAMDMFNQTVAVKDIQSLNRFIRDHMLEARDWRDKVQKLLGHFSDLSTAHRELVRVRGQQELLEPIEQLAAKYRKQASRLERAEREQAAINAYFRVQTIRLLEPENERCRREWEEATAAKTQLAARLSSVREDCRQLRNEIEQAGSQRLRTIPLWIDREQVAAEAKQKEHDRYHAALRLAGIPESVDTPSQFSATRGALAAIVRQSEARAAAVNEEYESLLGERDRLRGQRRADADELEQLARRRSNLPGNLATLRSRLCEDLGLSEKELPFAAELIAVLPEERAWEASIEMVLRPFALSLLVPEPLYQRVSKHVEQNRLVDAQGTGQRLVYLKVAGLPEEPSKQDRFHPQSLLRKLQFRSGHPLTPWVRGVLGRRFDYQCCVSMEEFAAARRFALTANRHVKTGGERHEKDDRPRASASRYFVLGWDNREKRRSLSEAIAALDRELQTLAERLSDLADERQHQQDVLHASRTALSIEQFEEIDAGRHRREIEALERERAELEASNDTIQTLRGRLQAAELEGVRLEQQRDEAVARERELQREIEQGEKVLEQARSRLETFRREQSLRHYEAVFPDLDKRLTRSALTVENLFAKEVEWKDASVAEIARLRGKLDPLTERLLRAMGQFLREFKAERDDLQAEVGAIDDFLGLLEQIRREDLPKHEQRFKDRLNDKVTQEVALFHAALQDECKQIEEKIRQLNVALGSLAYRPGTFMRLEPRQVNDREIRDFRRALRECLDGAFEGSAEADEDRFVRIERLVQRLGDQENTRWRDKVIDVRRWYDFAAREIEAENGETRSFYEDSAGQSGGEKAKLAFTILVAAIAYQYDLDPTGRIAGRFQFVVVDEMFSKVDDRYAEYALRLFEQFGLQLMIVAPLDAKARVTEPFVHSFLHVVKDERTNRSQIYSMTAQEYEQVLQGFDDLPQPKLSAENRGRPRTAK
ncbi:ATP-binding protein [Candidatus Laterigemmans baculatus]|uniref:ATP-binding protein n=1 Tax=Candidatus Laterigemmans baculatus TaxID=2770505 RepID=UPI0013DBD2A0|nr:ATP-binding protein [Candidatus Laterigemmans baculatus]